MPANRPKARTAAARPSSLLPHPSLFLSPRGRRCSRAGTAWGSGCRRVLGLGCADSASSRPDLPTPHLEHLVWAWGRMVTTPFLLPRRRPWHRPGLPRRPDPVPGWPDLARPCWEARRLESAVLAAGGAHASAGEGSRALFFSSSVRPLPSQRWQLGGAARGVRPRCS